MAAAAARASFSSDHSRIVNNKMPAPASPPHNSIMLKDHLLDDLSSCSSNGFRSYPRRQCCTKIRYLIQIDHHHLINKHNINGLIPPLPQNKSNSKHSILHKASNAVVNVFKKFHFSAASLKPKKAKASIILPRNLSRKLSKRGLLWKMKKTSDDDHEHNKIFQRLNSFEESMISKQKKSKVSVTAEQTKTSMISNNNSNSNSNSFVSSSGSYFTATSSDSSTVGGSSKINAAHHDVQKISKNQTAVKMNLPNGENVAATDNHAIGNIPSQAQKEQPSIEKDQFSPVSVLDFPFNNNDDDDNYDEDEVTSPFRRSKLYVKGSKQKLMTKVQRTKSLAQLKPVRLEDRINIISLSDHQSRITHDDSISELSRQSKSDQCEVENYEIEKKANAMLQLLKATMPFHRLFESAESILLGYFVQRVMEGNVSDYTILQEAKDWINDQTKDMFETTTTRDYKVAYIRDTEKQGAKWFKYDQQVETEDVSLELECQVFTSLVEEMLHDFYYI